MQKSQHQLVQQSTLQLSQLQMQQHHQLDNNIIVLRGSRNENGQIVIENKQDILAFFNEQQQQQQQHHEKNEEIKTSITDAVLTQLPLSTTIARKILPQQQQQYSQRMTTLRIGNNKIKPNNDNNEIKLEKIEKIPSLNKLEENEKNSVELKISPSNTILLQTPINANQLETVLLQTQHSANIKRIGTDNQLNVKDSNNNPRSNSSSSAASLDNNKGPYLLQTLKRLEKSQSILVIRNSGSVVTSSFHSNSAVTISSTHPSTQQNAYTSTNSTPKFVLSTSESSETLPNKNASIAANIFFTTSNNSHNSVRLSRTQHSQQTPRRTKLVAAPALGNRSNGRLTAKTSLIEKPLSSTVPSTSTTYLISNKTAGTSIAINEKSTTQSTSKNSSNNQFNADDHSTKCTTNRGNIITTPTTSLDIRAQQQNVPLGNDGEPIKLPDNLESLPRADSFPSQRHRWNTNEEIAAILISFDKHAEWQAKEVKTRPKSGSLLLYSRKKVRYRRDGYCWKKRKDGKTTREDHMKLKVQGTECIYGCYVHSAILPTFHRRCYWLLQNPDIVLVHYLNVPYPDDNKMAVIAPSITLWGDKKEWTKEELVNQLKPMLSTVTADDESDAANEIVLSAVETVETIVCQLMEKQRISRQSLLNAVDCGCGDPTCNGEKSCSHVGTRRPGLVKSIGDKRAGIVISENNYNIPTTAAPNVVVGTKLYSRWTDRRFCNFDNQQLHNTEQQQQNMPNETAIKFQIIPSRQTDQQQYNHGVYQQQQQQQQQLNIRTSNQNNNNQALVAKKNNLIIQQQQQQQQQQQFNQMHFNQNNLQQFITNNQNATSNNNTNNGNKINNNHNAEIMNCYNNKTSNNNNLLTAKATITTKAVESSAINNKESSTTTTTTTSNATIATNVRRGIERTIINNNDVGVGVRNNDNDIKKPIENENQHMTLNSNINHSSNNHNNNNSKNNNEIKDHNVFSNNSNFSSEAEKNSFYNNKYQQNHAKLLTTDSNNSASSSSNTTNNNQVESMCMSPQHQIPSGAGCLTANNRDKQNDMHVKSSPRLESGEYLLMALNKEKEEANKLRVNCNETNDCKAMILTTETDKIKSIGDSTNENSLSKNEIIDNSNNQYIQYNANKTSDYMNSNGCATNNASTKTNNNNNNMITENIIPTPQIDNLMTSNNDQLQHFQYNDGAASGFFNETLDLSQEDIQRTLIANLPFKSNVKDPQINPAGDYNASTNIELPEPSIKYGHQEENDDDADDVFANLDAFDMLVEFPEFDLDDKEAISNAALEKASSLICEMSSNETQKFELSAADKAVSKINLYNKLLTINDFSPEWSYTEGGSKVLIAGPWNSSANYMVLFDEQPVPTVLVQDGVLRCYCPPHEVGFSSLQVSCDGHVISNAVLFEYKFRIAQDTTFDSVSNDCMFKFTLLNRLSAVGERLQVKQEIVLDRESLSLHVHFEEKLVFYCQQLIKRTWLQKSTNVWGNGFKNMTLLHLSAALGYSKLVHTLLNWRSENPHFILETEIDALSQDVYGLTPLSWACARNHLETAKLLYKWNHNALKIKSYTQQTALELAVSKGHKSLVSEIYYLEHERKKKHNRGSLSCLSFNLNKHMLTEETKDGELAGLDSLDSERRHDGVFLRPVAITSPPSGTRFWKRSSVDSGINMDMRLKTGKSYKDLTRIQSFDVNGNDNLGMEATIENFNNSNVTNSLLSPLRKMDFALCEVSTGDASPFTEKDHDDNTTTNNDDVIEETINQDIDGVVGDTESKVLTLAEHIIAAMPERIKNEADEMMVLGSPMTDQLNSESSGINDSFMDPLLDSLPSTNFENDAFNFDFHDHSYRYNDVSTPCSSLSPASSGPLQSPASYSILGLDPSPSPPPSTKQLTEFLHASNNNPYPFETDFSKLTLTDTEQRELYEAAKCIQKAYRSYKGRQKLEEQNKERHAATVIQNYYRRYKQFAYYRQMTNAALVIQHGYRSYRNKRFKKSQSSAMILSNPSSQCSSNSECLSSFYDNYKNDQQQQDFMSSHPGTPKETSPSGPLKRTYSQSTRNQAARKIQQFMRQSRVKLQKERAEKERLGLQRKVEYPLSFQSLEQLQISAVQAERNNESELQTCELINSTLNMLYQS